MQATSLYRHYDKSGQLLYVGISLNPISRLQGHSTSDWSAEIARVDIERFGTRQEAESAERSAISSETPKHNAQHLDAVDEQINRLGNAIRECRKTRGMTQQDVAVICGVTRPAVAMWETGRVENLSLRPFLRLIRALELDPSELLSEVT